MIRPPPGSSSPPPALPAERLSAPAPCLAVAEAPAATEAALATSPHAWPGSAGTLLPGVARLAAPPPYAAGAAAPRGRCARRRRGGGRGERGGANLDSLTTGWTCCFGTGGPACGWGRRRRARATRGAAAFGGAPPPPAPPASLARAPAARAAAHTLNHNNKTQFESQMMPWFHAH